MAGGETDRGGAAGGVAQWHGRQLDVHVAWAGADVTDEGVAWGAGWVPITWLTGDLNLRARAMEADRYPVRPGAPPRMRDGHAEVRETEPDADRA